LGLLTPCPFLFWGKVSSRSNLAQKSERHMYRKTLPSKRPPHPTATTGVPWPNVYGHILHHGWYEGDF
jgi:hypothetical protein